MFPDWFFVVHASSDPRRLSKLRSEPLPLGREFFGVVDYELSGGGGIDRGGHIVTRHFADHFAISCQLRPVLRGME